MLDTVSGHFILRRMILSLFFFGLCRLALFILYGTGYGYAGCVYYCFFASSCLVVSFACCNEVMIHGHMGDVMDWDLLICLVCFSRFLFIIHIDLYLFYPSLLGYPSHSPYCSPYAYTCRYKHLSIPKYKIHP